MKIRNTVLFVVFLFFATGDVPAVPPSSLMIVRFHAEWCPSCKRWDRTHPGFQELREYADSKGIAVVVLDLTNDETIKEARKLAGQKGILPIFELYKEATGFAVIVDLRTQNVVARLESGSAYLYFFDSLFSSPPETAYRENVKKIDAALAAD